MNQEDKLDALRKQLEEQDRALQALAAQAAALGDATFQLPEGDIAQLDAFARDVAPRELPLAPNTLRA